jgi:hypothetical protein
VLGVGGRRAGWEQRAAVPTPCTLLTTHAACQNRPMVCCCLARHLAKTAMLCCAVLCCAVLCCAVLRQLLGADTAVLCCVLWCGDSRCCPTR